MPFWKAEVAQQEQRRTKDQNDDTTEPLQHPSHLTEQASWLAMFGSAYVFLYENACQTWTRSHRLALPPSSSWDPCKGADKETLKTQNPSDDESNNDLFLLPSSLDTVQVLAIFLLIVMALLIIVGDDNLQLQWEESSGQEEAVRYFESIVWGACRSIHVWFHPVSDIPLLQ